MKCLLLTSTVYECDTTNNMVHKLCRMMTENEVQVYTNSRCILATTLNTEEEIVKMGKSVDFIILIFSSFPASPHIYQEPYLKLLFQINRFDKTFHIDYFERSWNNKTQGQPHLLREEPFVHEELRMNCAKYFKRELYPDLRKCLPFSEPTDWDTESLPPQQKKYDVFCSFPQKQTGMRRECIEVSERLKAEGYNVIIRDDCTLDEYKKYVRESWITLDAFGAGQVNHRFLQIISQRSVCARQRYTVRFANDYDGSMIIEYDTNKELYHKLIGFLENKEQLVKMEANAYNHFLQYHTHRMAGWWFLRQCLDKRW